MRLSAFSSLMEVMMTLICDVFERKNMRGAAMFCKKCGKEIKEGAKFCTGCGSPVMRAQIQPEQARAQERPPVQSQAWGQLSVQEQKKTRQAKTTAKAAIAVLGVFAVAIAGIAIWLAVSFYEKPLEEETQDTDAVFGDAAVAGEQAAGMETSDMEASDTKTSDTEASDTETSDTKASDTETVQETDGDKPEPVLGDDSKDAEAIHKYKIVIGDVTWLQAFRSSLAYKNGYLAHINSQAEMDHITGLIEQQGYETYTFWIGAKRAKDGTEYHWVDADMHLVGDCLNDNENWLYIADNDTQEPSLWGSNQEDETCVDMFRRNGVWVWNDVQNDLQALNVSNGKIGYIVEIE